MSPDCDPCPDVGNYNEVMRGNDHLKFTLPVVYFHPPQVGNVFKALDLTLLRYEGREFERPTINDDGSIAYQRQDGAIPDEIDGFQRDPENAFRFVPMWESCKLRALGTRAKENGCIDIAAACNNPEAKQFGRPVKCVECQVCPVRKQ